MTEFKDLNFKLFVIQSLMTAGHFRAEVAQVLSQYPDRPRNTPHSKLLQFFKELDLDEDWLVEVEVLAPNVSNEIYDLLIPHWDGEDETFDIQFLDDVTRLPRLSELTLHSLAPEAGLDLKPLVKALNLYEVQIDRFFLARSETNKRVIKELKKRDVSVSLD